MERLRFIDTEVSEHEQKLLSNVLQTSLPGLEVFIEGDRYSIIRGKMRYNAIGIFYDGGRDDKVGGFQNLSRKLLNFCLSLFLPNDLRMSKKPGRRLELSAKSVAAFSRSPAM